MSYAYIAYYASQTGINIIESNCLKIEYLDLTDAINLTNVYPMADEEGEKTKPYRFRIKNACNVGADYNVNLEIIDIENRMPSYNIATRIDDNAKQILTDEIKTKKQETTEYVAVEAYTLYSGSLNPGETKEHDVRLWLDESADNSSQNKVFHSKVVISAVQNEIVFPDDLMKLAESIDTTPKEIDDLLLNTEDIDKIVVTKEAMELIVNSDYLKDEIKKSENYTETIKNKFLNSTVVSEVEKYNAGLPFYLFKNGNTGFTWTKDPDAGRAYWCSDIPSSCWINGGVATASNTLYTADTSTTDYTGGRLYTQTLDLSNYQTLGFSYTLAGKCEAQCNNLGGAIWYNNTSRIWYISHPGSNVTSSATVNISGRTSGSLSVVGWGRGYPSSTMSFSVPIMYVY